MTPPERAPLLEMRRISKAYPGVQALNNVSFLAERGEVHALLGANGAGKSTLIKILVGAVPRDSGTIVFDGEPFSSLNPQETAQRGIACIFQDPALIPLLTVEQNIFLGNELTQRAGWIRQHDQRQKALELLAPIAPNIDPAMRVQRLRTSERQLVALAKAQVAGTKLIIMDEPTASMTETEIEALFHAIERLKAQDICIVYVTHRLEEVYQIADRATVLRDGQHVATRAIADVPRDELIKLIIGRELRAESRRHAATAGAVVLQVEHLTQRGTFSDISFKVHAGEIVALAGLVGSGRTEIARAIIHADRFDRGTITFPDAGKRVSAPSSAVSAGVVMVPEDRKQQGIIPKMTVTENILLTSLPRFSSRVLGWIDARRVRKAVASIASSLELRPVGAEKRPIETLSGGNQQKALIARGIESQAALLILDEPTAGVDIGAKAEIHRIIFSLAAEGKGILLISSEVEEVLTLADRILVIRQGQLMGDLSGSSATSHDVLRLSLGEPHLESA
jgi:ABC-type sugar transport system ATPase subunit